MIGQWVTMAEAMEQFNVSRATIDRWRKKYSIREARLSKNRPLMFRIDDLAQADNSARKNNPVLQRFDSPMTNRNVRLASADKLHPCSSKKD